jgi:iron uptake system component EfeO
VLLRSRVTTATAVGTLMLVTVSCGSEDKPSATTAAATTTAAAVTPAAGAIAVSMSDNGCDPAALTAVAGDVIFSVTNTVDSDVKQEFELLTAEPKILAEEFFARGEKRDVTITVAAGSYVVICGASSNPRGTLTVTGEGGENSATLKVDAAALQANVDKYTEYVNGQLKDMVASNKALYDAIKSGDLTKSQQLYMPARVQWERIEPIAELFPDSDAKMDSRVDDFEKGPTDPAFTGWHRLEYLMFDQKTLDGAEPFAADLVKNIDELVGLIKGISIDAGTMINGSAGLIEEAATGKITGEEERYAGTSLLTFASNVEGAKEIIDLNADLLKDVDSALYTEIEASFDAIDAGLAKYATGDGTYAQYDTLTAADRAPLQAELANLSENLSTVAAAFGLEVS